MAIVATAANAQKIAASKVPAAVKASFTKQYPGTTAKWEKEDGGFEAGFFETGFTVFLLVAILLSFFNYVHFKLIIIHFDSRTIFNFRQKFKFICQNFGANIGIKLSN